MSRRPVTTRTRISDIAIDLFDRRGFDTTSVDEIADAAGIARRTLFRYYPSKNAIAWGDFDAHLDDMRALLAELPDDLPLADALAEALVEFNDLPEEHAARHRRRMRLLLTVPALQAHSMLMYADWRQAIAAYAATRLGRRPEDYQPQLIGWLALGTALAAYEQWLASPMDPSAARLRTLLVEGSRLLAVGIDAALSQTGPTMR
ncbi:putative TetR family transcriptional regulator [Gordonia araii NBRC 100433]|uniref:Putative TetR family transcriptional regulator n=1 Tax=Gordonia araii NBRC 100433 TaxID=1073574 RepID=G7GXR7_9ACTN|nr:mycofactocin system transcriptional regulator [Gordonia araii]NNG98413.1 mycofactocin system transcriptional regulator [Gordonia araii NBRC 100433]GAB08392.1 putative TetR family transcriptional regulator [Gordonia araii NBRC 100433]